MSGIAQALSASRATVRPFRDRGVMQASGPARADRGEGAAGFRKGLRARGCGAVSSVAGCR
jgi:hypothetical protein